MAQNEKQWHKNFLKYMNIIASHENYSGLYIKNKADGSLGWIATAKSEGGQKRIEWCIKKAQELGLISDSNPYPGMYADVMLSIHPTKRKVCQICGREMSLYYVYPNAIFLKSLNKAFNTGYTVCDSISDIWDDLINKGIDRDTIAKFLISKGNLNISVDADKDTIINALEYACRKGEKKCLGPGAMSNFPDRFDGFHTYNRCCRSREDTGRFQDNLKSYTKDRRAYEYWSDGNIHAADQFMGSRFFKETSADHIGPISLGFVHDPHYLQPMTKGDNSAKRDRLQIDDIELILATYERTKVYPMSWQSSLIWEYICSNYKTHAEKVATVYRDALKQNMANYMFALKTILDMCPKNGKDFLIKSFLEPRYECFNYSYEFNRSGDIISQTERHFTGRNKDEINRQIRIALTAVSDYSEKDNRNTKSDLTQAEMTELKGLCVQIEDGIDYQTVKAGFIKFVEEVERRIISSL